MRMLIDFVRDNKIAVEFSYPEFYVGIECAKMFLIEQAKISNWHIFDEFYISRKNVFEYLKSAYEVVCTPDEYGKFVELITWYLKQ